MILRSAAVLVLTGSFLFAADLSPASPWHLDGKALDLQTATMQAAVRALSSKPPIPNDPKLHGWTLQIANQSLGTNREAATCAIPLLSAPIPEKNFASRVFRLPPTGDNSAFAHPAMPTCKP